MADLGERIARDLTIRYIAVLVLVGGLAVASFLGLARIFEQVQSGAALVEIAAHQRMLVQRVALQATRYAALAGLIGHPGEVRRTLLEAVDQLEAAHGRLLAGTPEQASPQPPSDHVKALLFGPDGSLDQDIAIFAAAARRLAAEKQGALWLDHPDLVHIQAAAHGPLLNALEELARRYRQENEARMSRLYSWHGGALVLLVALLVLSAVGIFHPMVARIKEDIRQRSLAEKSRRESEERLWTILEESPVGVSVSRRSDGKVVFANTRFCEIVGATRDEVIGHSARHHYVDLNQRDHVVEQLKERGRIDDAEVDFRRKDGAPFTALLTLRPTDFKGEQVNLAWVYDISHIKAAQQELRLMAKIVETASEAVVVTNANNEVEFVNPAFTTITEFEPHEILGKNPRMLQSGRHDRDFYRSMWRSLRETGRWRGEIWNRRKSGEFYAEWLSITAIKDDNGHITHHVAVFSDITHRKEDEERVWRQANYDALTGLPNRSLFVDRLAQAVRQSRRDNKKFALMFIDLDGFKAVNDTLGHAAGDLLLQQTGARLSECLRSSDTVARLAGDEFTIIMQGIRSREDAARMAAKILDALARPFDLEGAMARVRGSIGIAIFPDNAPDETLLLKMADEAMYNVKRHGKNNFEFASATAVSGDSVVPAE